MRIDAKLLALLEGMVTAGQSARMVVDLLKERMGEAESSRAASAFLQFRAAYPKRDGSQPWTQAEKKFNALVSSGVDPTAIIAAAIKFKEEETKRNTVGTPFIPMVTTWLNQRRFADMVDQQSVEQVAEPNWDLIVASFVRFGTWSAKHGYGPDPYSPACRCPREILLKHGVIREAAE